MTPGKSATYQPVAGCASRRRSARSGSPGGLPGRSGCPRTRNRKSGRRRPSSSSASVSWISPPCPRSEPLEYRENLRRQHVASDDRHVTGSFFDRRLLDHPGQAIQPRPERAGLDDSVLGNLRARHPQQRHHRPVVVLAPRRSTGAGRAAAQSKMSSGRMTANGSLPTALRACSTAWPMPSGSRCSTDRDVGQPSKSGARFRAGRACRAAQGSFPTQAPVAKWSSKAPLPRLITITMSRDSRSDDFLDHELDGGRIDDREQFLGHRLGRRQHAGAKAGGQDNGFFYLHGCLVNSW